MGYPFIRSQSYTIYDDCTLCDKYNRLVRDHCHRCNIVRGLICIPCNNYMWIADEAITNLKGTPDRIPLIKDLYHFLTIIGAHKVFNYQNNCNC